MTEGPPNWKVLLIGGSSGVGKTRIAHELAHHLAVDVLQADDIRIALQQVTKPEHQPDLHVFLAYSREKWLRPESIRDDWIAVGHALMPSLRAIIAHHVVVPGAGKIVIEGDSILPALMSPSGLEVLRSLGLSALERDLRAVFIVEHDEAKLLGNLRARGHGFNQWTHAEQEAFVRASRWFGEWLTQDAIANKLPVLAAQPYDLLVERILAAVQG